MNAIYSKLDYAVTVTSCTVSFVIINELMNSGQHVWAGGLQHWFCIVNCLCLMYSRLCEQQTVSLNQMLDTYIYTYVLTWMGKIKNIVNRCLIVVHTQNYI